MTDSANVLVIGGGHNGLVCAAYLAKAGCRVTLLEAGEQAGGLAATNEFAPGFRASCAHLLYLLDDEIARALSLESHGLAMAKTGLDSIALDNKGGHITLSAQQVEGPGISDSDRDAYREYRRMMSKFAGMIGAMHRQVPPRISNRRRDLFTLGKMALRARMMGRKDLREFLRIAAINIYDVLEEFFDNPQIKGALGLDAVLGSFSGPRSNNTVFTALHRMSGNNAGAPGAVSVPAGGMGAVSDAMAAAAIAAGVQIRFGARVSRIRSDGLKVLGVELEGGEQIDVQTIVSNADPRTTMLELLGARYLEADCARRFNNFRARGYTAKLHLALNGLPDFKGLDESQLGQRLLIAPDPDYVDRAFNPCKYGEYSPRPVMEITLPSVHDRTLAPKGRHVLSAIVQYAPYDLAGGWDKARDPFLETVMDTLAEYAPDIRDKTLASELLTPVDLEQRFGVSGGHWHHGELSLDQFLMLRPVPKAAQYRMPVTGLYLCGAGCHPGGGVMGSAGRNAAEAVLAGKGEKRA